MVSTYHFEKLCFLLRRRAEGFGWLLARCAMDGGIYRPIFGRQEDSSDQILEVWSQGSSCIEHLRLALDVTFDSRTTVHDSLKCQMWIYRHQRGAWTKQEDRDFIFVLLNQNSKLQGFRSLLRG